MVFISCLISVYDNVMNVVFWDTLPEIEKNPVASWIIDRGGVSALVYTKAVGTMLACLAMIRLVYTRYKFAIIPVFIFQVCLFFYVTCYAENDFTRSDDFFQPLKLFFEFYLGKL
jgi:hypothetical protein